MAYQVLLCLAAICIIPFCQGSMGVDEYGKGVSTCDIRKNDLKDQICPSTGEDRKYVRIKTYNGRYLWAYPTNQGDKRWVRTRCCGKTESNGLEDSVHPGTRTTFKVHCSPDKSTVRFEVFKYDINTPSGYFLYAAKRYGMVFSEYKPSENDESTQFILKRWRGSLFGIKSAANKTWWTFGDDDNGFVDTKSRSVERYPDIPPFYDIYSLELVPKGCVEIKPNEQIKAAPNKPTPEECERQPDRCYWTTGWKDNSIIPATCYYRKGTMCYQLDVGSRQLCPYENAKDCEAANCCYDYGRNQCYHGKA